MDRSPAWNAWDFFEHRRHGPMAIAHAGGKGEAAENSIAAFVRATSTGLRYVEIDLCGTPDGDLIAWHGDAKGRAQLMHPRHEQPPGAIVAPRFEDVLEAVPTDTRFFLDLKNDAAIHALARVVRRTNRVDRVCVGSFKRERTRDAVRAVARETGTTPCTTLTILQVGRLLSGAPLRTRGGRPVTATSCQVPCRVATDRLVHAAHRDGLLVSVWTVNDPPAMHQLLDRGIDGLMTDYPSMLKNVLLERGEWWGG